MHELWRIANTMAMPCCTSTTKVIYLHSHPHSNSTRTHVVMWLSIMRARPTAQIILAKLLSRGKHTLGYTCSQFERKYLCAGNPAASTHTNSLHHFICVPKSITQCQQCRCRPFETQLSVAAAVRTWSGVFFFVSIVYPLGLKPFKFHLFEIS